METYYFAVVVMLSILLIYAKEKDSEKLVFILCLLVCTLFILFAFEVI